MVSSMRNIVIVILCTLLAACSDTSDKTVINKTINEADKTFTILALGDSLTEGLGVKEQDNYPSVLQKNLPKHITVINAGLSGETSSGLINRLNWVLKQKPNLTILNIGANDAIRGLPLSLTNNNIDKIITQIKQADSDVILAGMQIYDNLGKQYVDEFKQMYPKLAEKHNVPLIPFFLENVAGKPKLNQNDMIHPNAQGYQIIVKENILPIVKDYLTQH